VKLCYNINKLFIAVVEHNNRPVFSFSFPFLSGDMFRSFQNQFPCDGRIMVEFLVDKAASGELKRFITDIRRSK